MEIIDQEESGIKNIFNRFRKRDFSGTIGQVMKNSSYQLAQNLIFKFGSLFFTIVLARMLMPERMGLYTLALSTIILFASFSDLGISGAMITFVSRMLGRGNFSKAKGYMKKLFKWKLYLVFISAGILLFSSYFVAEFYYAKPIFYALLAGGLYIPIVSLVGFFEQILKTTENFKIPMIKEIIFQTSRFILVPLSIFIFLRIGFSDGVMILITLLSIIMAYLISLLFLTICIHQKLTFLRIPSKNLKEPEVKELKRFIYPLSATAFAGLFFGYIDTLMLGRLVTTSFIAYYGAAFSLVGGASTIIGFMSMSLMPIFTKTTGRALESIFKKTRSLTALISVTAGVFTYFIAGCAIEIIYGEAYLPAISILKLFTIIIVLSPIIGLYDSYFTTQKKTKQLAYLIFMSAILNIILNIVGILYGLKVGGEMGAVYGAVGATILSRVAYLAGLVVWRKK